MKKRNIILISTAIILTLSLAGCESSAVSTDNVLSETTNAHTEYTNESIKEKLSYSSEYDSDYVTEIAKTVNTVNSQYNSEDLSYIFISDTHIGADSEQDDFMYQQLYAVADVAKNSNVDFICVGGDIEDGRFTEEDGGKQKAIDILNRVCDILKEAGKPVFILKGNHDDNSFSAQQDPSLIFNPDYILSSEEWYNATMANFKDSYSEYQDGYFYYDIPGKDTRVICLNMSNSSDTITDGLRDEMGMYYYGYHDEQMEWLLSTAMTKDSGDYVFLCHDGFRYPMGYNDSTNRDTLKAILEAAYTHSNFSNNKFSKDFTDWNGNVLLYNHGHMHMEGATLSEELGGLPLLSMEAAHIFNYAGNSNANMSNWSGYSRADDRKVGNVDGAVFDVVIRKKDKIDIIRFGNGKDSIINIK